MQKIMDSQSSRPNVYDYGSPNRFLSELFEYYKTKGRFSLRNQTKKPGACSQALISQILNGRRNLTRDNLSSVAVVMKLTLFEVQCIDAKLKETSRTDELDKASLKIRTTRNHLLMDWLHPYVKDLVNLKGFNIDSEKLSKMLGGIVSSSKVKNSVDFLLREGFWRRSENGRILPEEDAVITTNEIASEKIRNFHKKAIEIACKGLDKYPVQERKASTILLSVNRSQLEEVRGLVDSFQNQLLDYIDKNPAGEDLLVQVAIHLTPIGKGE